MKYMSKVKTACFLHLYNRCEPRSDAVVIDTAGGRLDDGSSTAARVGFQRGRPT